MGIENFEPLGLLVWVCVGLPLSDGHLLLSPMSPHMLIIQLSTSKVA